MTFAETELGQIIISYGDNLPPQLVVTQAQIDEYWQAVVDSGQDIDYWKGQPATDHNIIFVNDLGTQYRWPQD